MSPQIITDAERLSTQNTTGLENPLIKDDKKEEFESSLIYTPEQKTYLTFLQKRLTNADLQKKSPLPEFNGRNYYQDFEENIKIAHTKLPKKENEDDVVVSAGTVEAKLDTLLAHINNLDLASEVLAFDRENNLLSDLGTALTDTIFMTEQNDGGDLGGDEEKKILRQRELLAQNAVFVQEEWLRKFERKKKLTQKYDGQFKDWNQKTKNWNENLELVFEGPSRTLLYGLNVYLGDMTEFFMEKQPYFFIAFQESYDLAKTRYGQFENWKYVKAGAIPAEVTQEQKTIYDNKWRLTSIKDNHVEIILYQDKPNDEFQILINGVCMLPIGFPLSAVSPGGEYNVVKQVFRVINHKFAYGKAFVAAGNIQKISEIIDEMIKLFILKTRKSIAPPYANTSGRVISRKVLSPGRISMGISPDSLKPIGTESQGVTSNEFQILKELQDRVDKSTVSNQFAGQQGKANTTATEVLELQRQAKQTLGLTVAACVLMEKKLGYLRLYNIVENWFNPIDTKVVTIDDVRKEISMFRKTTRETNIDNAGMGERQIIPTDQPLPSDKEIRAMELTHQKATGKDVQMIYLNAKAIKTARVRWYIVINPKEKEGSAFFKVLFREMLGDMIQLMNLGSVPKLDGIEEEFSRVWGKSRNKLFGTRAAAAVQPGADGTPAVGGRPNTSGVPNMASMAGVSSG
jgi:hypothetical protein